MGTVQEFTIRFVATSIQEIPTCTHNHSVPGLVFSTSGYTGNLFHDFTDVVIPLFLTSREFDGQVKFLVTNKRSWRSWRISKYKEVLRKLSKEFLGGAYSLERERAIEVTGDGGGKRPRLLIISRKSTRLLMNEGEIVTMATGLGFEVVVTEADSNLARFANLVNSCDVLMGVHGAGLTNMVFLPKNAIVIQILPLGGLEWLGRTDFGDPAKDMNLRYLEYQIGEEESSLRQEYPPDHQVFKDPYSILKQGWLAFRAVYLDKQNVTLDVGRFQATLLEALNLLH
ncbi:hypothetical protein RHGRI_023814 [Rhododendron griersonianum]|uniref:Glycosyltransferase 61 catalytic domain-containing protein n=1 Tax=Rhododendron griersonianum TaxID=479676 RepID=A0AAV6J6U0_9ERIC|nr:hypothetical protein RHGRI_023814 [Rhododendron griersonianum]